MDFKTLKKTAPNALQRFCDWLIKKDSALTGSEIIHSVGDFNLLYKFFDSNSIYITVDVNNEGNFYSDVTDLRTFHLYESELSETRGKAEVSAFTYAFEFLEEKLLGIRSCPFCGSKAKLYKIGEGLETRYEIHCTNSNCFLHKKAEFEFKADIIKIWNTRI